MSHPINPIMTTFHQRRHRLLSALPINSIALIASGNEINRNRDTGYAFRPHSDFFYLTGFAEPEAVLVLKRTSEDQQTLLFLRDRNPERETWDGIRLGVTQAPDVLGVDQAQTIDNLTSQLPDLLSDMTQVFVSYEQADYWTNKLLDAIGQLKRKTRQGVTAPHSISDLDTLLHEDRLIKDETAIAGLKRAGEITVAGHMAGMRATTAGGYEFEVQAALEQEFRRLGAECLAFESIVAGGKNACILHYNSNRDSLKAGDLLLIDAGAEVDGYAGDCTHTFPISGKFSAAQSALYDLVLSAQHSALAEIKPNTPYNVAHQTAVKVITQGLIDLKILAETDLNSAIEQGLYKPFYMHQTGHWLGCDVHDVGTYKHGQAWRRLSENMVLTVEPGIYIAPDNTDVTEKWRGIGIRIEDSVIVTAQGHEVITQGLPRSRKEIESCMRSACTTRTIGKWVGKILPSYR